MAVMCEWVRHGTVEMRPESDGRTVVHSRDRVQQTAGSEHPAGLNSESIHAHSVVG